MYWTAADVITGFLTLCLGAIGFFLKRRRGRKIIFYNLAASVPILRNIPEIKSAGLSVIHQGEKLADPHVLEVQLTSKRRRDIPTTAFDQDRPLSIDVGAPIVALLETSFVPDQAPLPAIATEGSSLKIGPALIRRRQEMTLFVLADGPSDRLACANPLIDFTLRYGEPYQPRLIGNMPVKKVVTWAVVIFLAYYLVTKPHGAADAMQHLFGLLQAAGASLANWLNSL